MSRSPSRVVIAAPMSFTGSAGRVINLFWRGKSILIKLGIGSWAIPVILGIWWLLVISWYAIFGIFLIPFRLLRRGARKRKRGTLRHGEILAAILETGRKS